MDSDHTEPLSADSDPIENKLNLLDSMKFTSRTTTRGINNKKRKDNPVEIKYETTAKGQVEYDPKNTKKNFGVMYDLIKEMRKEKNAAVDLYGCHTNADKGASKEVQDFQTLVSLLISVQNRDESTAAAMERFKAHGLTVQIVNNMSEDDVLKVMGGVNFNKTKAKNIKAAARLIADNHNGRVPDSWDELVAFPGVGNKIALILLNTAYNKNAGIGVDTHVHRVSNRLGWAKTKLPDQTRVELESFVPKRLWSEVNQWMVGFGQQICQPINPKCDICLLNRLCPEGRKTVKNVKGKKKEEIEEEEDDAFDELQVKRTKKVKNNKTTLESAKGEKEETVTYVKKQRRNNKEEEKEVKVEAIDMEEETKIEDVTIDEDGNEQGYTVKKVVVNTKNVNVKKEDDETKIEEIIKVEETEVVTRKRVTRSNSKRNNL